MVWTPSTAKWWQHMVKHIGAMWLHDGHPERPYARLTNPNPQTGKPRNSNAYFDGTKLAERPALLLQAAKDLVSQLTPEERSHISVACGSPFGAITLAAMVALALREAPGRQGKECLAWYTEHGKKLGPNGKPELVLERFGPAEGHKVLVVDDAFTSGGTSDRTAAILESKGAIVLPVYLYIINRNQKAVHNGKRIVSLIDGIDGLREWDEGDNPFTGGPERVTPLEPKHHWHELTRPY